MSPSDKTDQPIFRWHRVSNVDLCLTLFILTNIAHAWNDPNGVSIYDHARKMLIKAQQFSQRDLEQSITKLFVLYGSKTIPKPGLIRLSQKPRSRL